MTETTLARIGLRGKRVRVCTLTTPHGTKLVRVEWREGGKRVRESWPDTRDNRKLARAYAEGVAERLAQRGTGQRVRVTVLELAQRYIAANDHWRPATVRNVTERLHRFTRFTGEAFPADQVTPEMLDEYRAALRRIPLDKTGKPMVANQVAHHVTQAVPEAARRETAPGLPTWCQRQPPNSQRALRRRNPPPLRSDMTSTYGMERTGIEPATPSIYTDAGARAEALTPQVRRGFGGAAPSMGGRFRAVNGLRTATGLLSLLLLTGCQGDGVEATCKRLLSLARTSTDTLIALTAKPSDSYMACGYDWRPDTTRAVVEDTTGGGR